MSKKYFVGGALCILILAGLACNTLVPPRPEISWDARPEALIVRGTFCCGLVPITLVQNYIPDVQIWGDGRMIWTQSSSTGNQRRVLEAHLTPEQMTDVLQRAVNDGFFGWKDSYADYTVTDYPSQCLTITLTSTSKTVCEYFKGAPKAFHTLYAYLANGAGQSGTDFVPTRGYLKSELQNYGGQPAPTINFHWPANSFGFSLSEATNGKWVEGEALAFAWHVVSENPWGEVIRDGEEYYQISVQILGVNQMEPPSP